MLNDHKKDKRKFQGNRKLYALTKKNNNNVALYYGSELNELNHTQRERHGGKERYLAETDWDSESDWNAKED